jgi:hypothetical protein
LSEEQHPLPQALPEVPQQAVAVLSLPQPSLQHEAVALSPFMQDLLSLPPQQDIISLSLPAQQDAMSFPSADFMP